MDNVPEDDEQSLEEGSKTEEVDLLYENQRG